MNTEEVEILLVEDNPTDAELTLRVLKQNRLVNRILLVKDGAEALDFLFARGAYSDRDFAKRPKMILLDLELPKVSGIEVLRKIKADDRTREIPVVVLSSSGKDKHIAESYKVGVNSYIVKPVDFDRFVQVVGELGLYWLVLNRPPV